ncbi:Mrp/NBP35 family ATP-binding protein [Desulfovibrio piger]|uniref:Mrp/NBP35 family ATP-binding protein n=1 Tax=Desulfovibrio piger TaxID=901 RepID=UPI0026F1141B|nr:Mrp/NBP35 family ATP-binding protein [Desulfovibrio piger]
MSSCSSCSSASGCSSKGNPGGAGCMESAMARQDQIIADRLAHIRHKIFVMSGKGGVGKSSVTVNTAAALAHRGFKVGILDVDMHGPSVPNLLGLKATIEMNEKNELIPAMYNENLAVISMDSFLKDKDTAILWRGPKKTGAIRQFLTDVQWGALDYLVIDSPPGTGDEHLTVLDAIPDAGCIVVTTPQEISLADVRKALDFLKQVQAPVLGIVENMSGLSCPHCGKEIDLFKKGGGEQLAKQYELPFLGAIPLDPATVIAADRGVPVVSLTENSPARQGFMALADAVIAATEAE